MKKIWFSAVTVFLCVCLLCGCSQTAQGEGAATKAGAETTSLGAAELVSDIPTTQYFTDATVSEADIETIVVAGINAPSAMNGQPWHFSVITDATVLQQISDGMGGGMGFGGGMPPSGAGMPGGEVPENMTPPDGMQLPEGMEPPVSGSSEGMQFPEAAEDMGLPAATDMPADFAGGAPSGTGGVSKAGLTDAPLAIVISCTAGSELDAGLACQNMSVTAQLLGYGTKIISSPTMALNGEKQDEYRELLGIPDNQSAVAILLIGCEDTGIDDTVDGYTGATTRNPMDEMVTFVTPSQNGE